jgi:hypothetical protein
MSNQARARIERFVEVAVFAPVGVALTLRDMAPTFVNMFVSRGRAEIDRRQHSVEQRVRTVKSTGEVALAFGVPMVRNKVFRHIDQMRGRDVEPPEPPESMSSSQPDDAEDPVADSSRAATSGVAVGATANVAVGGSNGSNGSTRDLAIPGYDALAASQVVERLVGRDAAELRAVRDYEASHRNRRTILGKIEQLSGA